MNKPDSTAAEQFISENYHGSVFQPHNYGITIAMVMTEFAALESAKEAQLFAEWIRTRYYQNAESGNGWFSIKAFDREVYTTEQLWKEYQLYKEGKG